MAATLPYSQPATYQQWAADLETYGGLPQTPGETTLISAWEQSENPVSQIGGYTKAGGYNALNTSRTTNAQGQKVSSGLEPGSSFIPVFPDIASAMAATWATLTQSNYAPELAALQGQSDAGLVSALGAPGHVWGSSPSLVSQILGQGPSTASSGGNGGGPATTATLASFPGGALDPLNFPGEIAGAGGSALASGILGVISVITDPLKKFIEDAGLVVLGIVLFFVALAIIAHSAGAGGASSNPAPAPEQGGEEEERPPPPEAHRAYAAGHARGVAETRQERPQRGGKVKSEGDSRAMQGEAKRGASAVEDVALAG